MVLRVVPVLPVSVEQEEEKDDLQNQPYWILVLFPGWWIYRWAVVQGR
jgi:hypothetical protein